MSLHGRLWRLEAGRYRTEDGRYLIERDDHFPRVCHEPHTVPLRRHEQFRDLWTGTWVRSYRCPGRAVHPRVRWQIWDAVRGDYLVGTGPGAFATLAAAAAALGFTGKRLHW